MKDKLFKFSTSCHLCKKYFPVEELVPLWRYVFCKDCFDIVDKRIEKFQNVLFKEEKDFYDWLAESSDIPKSDALDWADGE